MYEIGRFLYEIGTRHLRIASGERTHPSLWTPPSLPLRGGIEEREFAWGGIEKREVRQGRADPS